MTNTGRDERRSQLAHRDALPPLNAEHIVDERTGDVTVYADAESEQWIAAEARAVFERGEMR
jgi:hypothetical protein